MRVPVGVDGSSTKTPIVMYCPDSNGVASPSNFTQNVASDSCASSRRISEALYCGASGRMTRSSVSITTAMVARGMPLAQACDGHPGRRDRHHFLVAADPDRELRRG